MTIKTRGACFLFNCFKHFKNFFFKDKNMLILSYVFLMALLNNSLMGQDYDEIDGVKEKRSSHYFSNDQGICFLY